LESAGSQFGWLFNTGHLPEVELEQTDRMRSLNSSMVAVLTVSCALGSVACAPYLPPTTVPAAAVPSAEIEAFRTALKTYIDQTQPFRKDAAVIGEEAPNQASADGSEDAVRLRQRTLADAIQTKVRPAAQQGDVLSPPVADLIRRQLAAVFRGPDGDAIRDALEDQNEGLKVSGDVAINHPLASPRVPPVLMHTLPQLPQQVEFAFSGRTLILGDTDSGLVVDFIPAAFPKWSADDHVPASPPLELVRQPGPLVEYGPAGAPVPVAMLALPAIAGSTSFALIGDSGSGDAAQTAVANAMLRYYTTAGHFTFVLMLGDNLYDDDYQGEFSGPYKGLLEQGVLFYAVIGNHDRDLEQHYKPFHMTDRLYFAFTEGNARFVALNSNRPGDAAQAAWFDQAFGNTGTKWRIGFFHHPLYSSGDHAQESRDSIRPALEPALIRNHVDVVFTGHDHLYERIAPQNGIRYFVSGGGGRSLYDFHRSSFDEAGSSEHHFMVAEIAGDLMFFEAISPAGRALDCGVLWRTPEAAAQPQENGTTAWQDACRRAIAGQR